MEQTLSAPTSDFHISFLRHLGDLGLHAETPRVLTGGRSNRVWRIGDTVVKLYERSRDNPLFANDPICEVAALSALAGTGMAPQLVSQGVFEGRHWIAYCHIEGAPWQQAAAPVARLLGRLHDQPLLKGLPDGANGSAMLEAQTAAILKKCRTGNTLHPLCPQGEVPAVQKPRLIHGDPVPGNLVAHDGTLTLIDWQCPKIGDPAEDLALFLSPAMQFLYRGAVLSPAEEKAFIAAYPDRQVVARLEALLPWFHWRMAAYCLWRSEQGGDRDREALQLEIAALQSISPSMA